MTACSIVKATRYRDQAFKENRWSAYQFWRGYVGALLDSSEDPVSQKILDKNFDLQPGILKEQPK